MYFNQDDEQSNIWNRSVAENNGMQLFKKLRWASLGISLFRANILNIHRYTTTSNLNPYHPSYIYIYIYIYYTIHVSK